jgi:hypothetical protein
VAGEVTTISFSLIYRVFYAYSQMWPGGKKNRSGQLSERLIQHYAVMNLALGLLLVALGIASVLVEIFY